jgi:PAS domain S-box-containing protein
VERIPSKSIELKPFRSDGLVRRVTPFMGAGLVALVVFVDPDFAHLPVGEGLAIALAALAVLAVILPIDWDRLPRLSITVPLVVALALGWGGVLSPTSPAYFASVGAGAVVVVGVYALPWDRFPRWVHNLPVFGGLAAVFVFQLALPVSSMHTTSALLLFPLILTTVLFAALYHTRNELLAAAGIATIGMVVIALVKGNQSGELGTALLVTVVLWVVVVTVHEVVRQLDLSHIRLQGIIDNSLNAIVTMNAKGVVTGWNPQAESTFGWTAEETLGKALADTIIPEQYRNAHRNGLVRYLATGEGPVLGKVLDLAALHKSGREFPVEISISPAATTGEEVLFVGFLRDVSARKKADEAIQRLNDQLRVANQHKSEFLANMSHELRTPLNAILGFSDLLIDDVNEKFDAVARRRFLGQINSSGRHLLALINDILDLSKVEAGQMILRLENVVVQDVVREVINTIEPLASKKSLQLESHMDGVGQVPADAGKLKQMLLNLVSNAVKFTNEGGRVTISAKRLSDVIDISVADTGIGIAAADRKHLFEEFHQVDSSISRQQEGTGLGLALTKRFVQLHGGAISVVSERGKGSVFTIRLPLVQRDTEIPAVASGASDTRPLVLVVEDNLQAANLLKRYLDRGGFRTVVAVSGTEAVAKARELLPVAITLDILLPGIDGWNVLTELKHDEATRDIPVVVISVVDDPELGRALGAIDYLVKPVDGNALLQRLAKYTFTNKVGTQETRILVVDDEPANVEWLEGVLKPAGFCVLSAGGGQEGIDLAKRERLDLVLLDLMMPRVSGFDVVEALHADEKTRSIPIMVLTAKDLTSEDKRQLNGHVAAVLSRGSTGAPDLLDWLQRLVTTRI